MSRDFATRGPVAPGSDETGIGASAALVLDLAQVRALASPSRADVFATLLRTGSASIREIAAVLGRPADALYHHVRRLVACGLVRASGKRPSVTRPEEVFQPVGTRIVTDARTRDPAYLDALAGLFASHLRGVARRLDRAVRDPDVRRSGDDAHLRVQTRVVRLSDEAHGTLNAKLQDVTEFLAENALSEGGTQYQVLTVKTPIPG